MACFIGLVDGGSFVNQHLCMVRIVCVAGLDPNRVRVNDRVQLFDLFLDGARRRSFVSAEFLVIKDSILSPEPPIATYHTTGNVLTPTSGENENHRLNGAVPRQHNRKLFAALGVWQHLGF